MGRYLKPLILIDSSEPGRRNRSIMHLSQQWVQLVSPPSLFSSDQALLLCRLSKGLPEHLSEAEWVAWVPDYGEVTLHWSEFFFPHDWN